MNETLEQIALRVAGELADIVSQRELTNFATRLVAELAKWQEPAAWQQWKGGDLHAIKYERDDLRGDRYTWIPMYVHPAPLPKGWQLVPVEPTEAMEDAFYQGSAIPDFKHSYKAMLEAAKGQL